MKVRSVITMSNNSIHKPLGRKAYGSIPHLPGSRLGPGDHCGVVLRTNCTEDF